MCMLPEQTGEPAPAVFLRCADGETPTHSYLKQFIKVSGSVAITKDRRWHQIKLNIKRFTPSIQNLNLLALASFGRNARDKGKREIWLELGTKRNEKYGVSSFTHGKASPNN
ncbi:predicted protein [Sclerotinia sclerotiorum 1980 UF-70]|uniref:Uncharacterized protein n=1 Tax=Sclerotinia sclerotiorum (strain ATCC 18683 / 1980 / Ss-1) TaxID=665079 RepID=A7EDQ4_SCLS1|nr:predicted protein [Sclerotinia sclerotiorum 1980 UF-70]EDO00970.1 predicted protein [Sclerotinia sclerotiorum 1980 UF-70]